MRRRPLTETTRMIESDAHGTPSSNFTVLDSRLTRVEAFLERMAEEWARERDDILNEIRGLRRENAMARQIPWQGITLATAVGLAVVGSASTLVWTLISQNARGIEREAARSRESYDQLAKIVREVEDRGNEADERIADATSNAVAALTAADTEWRRMMQETAREWRADFREDLHAIEEAVDTIRASRWTNAQGERTREHVYDLDRRLATVEGRITSASSKDESP